MTMTLFELFYFAAGMITGMGVALVCAWEVYHGKG